jgi:hypothetical protein
MTGASLEVGETVLYNPDAEFGNKLGLETKGGEIVASEENIEFLKNFYSSLGYTITYTLAEGWEYDATAGIARGGWDIFDTFSITKNDDSLFKFSDDSDKEWENPYDELHNSLEEINDLLRERERLERRYQRLISRRSNSVKDFKESQKARIASYEEENQKLSAVN